jgi:hypothetical protein
MTTFFANPIKCVSLLFGKIAPWWMSRKRKVWWFQNIMKQKFYGFFPLKKWFKARHKFVFTLADQNSFPARNIRKIILLIHNTKKIATRIVTISGLSFLRIFPLSSFIEIFLNICFLLNNCGWVGSVHVWEKWV